MSAGEKPPGTSRSGRVIKKSAKLIEMEEIEKTSLGLQNNERSNSRISDGHVNSNGAKSVLEPEHPHSLKKKLKIRIPPPDKDFSDAVMMEGDDEGNSYDVDDSAPSLSTSYTATPVVAPITIANLSNSGKIERPPIKTKITIPEDQRKVKPLKISRKLIEGETSANKLFAQITSGTPHIDHRRKGFRRNEFNDKTIGNLDFGSDDENSSEPSLTIATSTEDYVAAAVAHAKTLKATPKSSSDKSDWKARSRPSSSAKTQPESKRVLEKKRKGPSITAYTLFSKENRARVQKSSPNLDFANLSRKLGKIWQSLPKKEKEVWRRRAQKISQSENEDFSPKVPPKEETPVLTSTPMVRHGMRTAPSSRSLQPPPTRRKESEVVNLASHLKLLGTSLSTISQKLDHNPSLPVAGSLSVLLDSTLCAIAPLICLSRLVEPDSLSKEVQDQMMDNISYFMPGV